MKHGVGVERWELSVRRECILADTLRSVQLPSFPTKKQLSVSLSKHTCTCMYM